jgi:hypothetical protein
MSTFLRCHFPLIGRQILFFPEKIFYVVLIFFSVFKNRLKLKEKNMLLKEKCFIDHIKKSIFSF